MLKKVYFLGVVLLLSIVIIGIPFNPLTNEGSNTVHAQETSEELDFVLVKPISYNEDEIGINYTPPSTEDPGTGGGGGTSGLFYYTASRGAKTATHSTVYNARNLPDRSTALSSKDLVKEGSLKQRRYYDESGKAYKDIDYHHGGVGHTFPHAHYFNWSNPIPRGGEVPLGY